MVSVVKKDNDSYSLSLTGVRLAEAQLWELSHGKMHSLLTFNKVLVSLHLHLHYT